MPGSLVGESPPTARGRDHEHSPRLEAAHDPPDDDPPARSVLITLLALGGIGLVALVVGLLVGEIDIDLGPDWLSIPALAALVGAFGFVGAAALSFGAPTAIALAIGAVAGVVLAVVVVRLARALMHMPTDAPMRSSDLVGRQGRVVTATTAERSGEVLVHHAGQQLKVAARADETLTVGAEVVVVEVLSPTFVRVESRDRFWSP